MGCVSPWVALAFALTAVGAVGLLFLRVRIAIEAERAPDGPASGHATVALGPVPIAWRSATAPGSASRPSEASLALLRALLQRSRAAWPRVRPLLRWLVRRVGWSGLAEAILGVRSEIRVRGIEGRVEYALEDPALEGELYGHLSAWLLVVDPEHRFALVPGWTFENRWSGRVRAVVDVRAVRLLARLTGRIAWQAWRGPALREAEAAAGG